MRGSVEIKESAKLAEIFQVFSWLDGVRWSYVSNYNLINYCADNLTPDEKLLTHWLCYVTDRQTGFERVWEVGGYVLSHLVRTYTRGDQDPKKVFLSYLRYPTARKGLRLECPLEGENSRLGHFDIHSGPVEFASRYMPSDTIAMLRTLLILERLFERSLARFIYDILGVEEDQSSAIRMLAVALHFLTYKDLGQVETDQVPSRMADIKSDLKSHVVALRKDPGGYLQNLAGDFNPFGKKRLWCSIRDYLKSPEFNAYLVSAIETIDPVEAKRWKRRNARLKSALQVIELPGDVWNNNRVFRDGLFTPRLGPIPKTWDMPRTVRSIYEQMKGQGMTFYPEQLDVTFDFVPRMCDRLMCHVCPFGRGILRLCHQKRGLFCPVTLAACGYVHPCNPKKCPVKENGAAGACANAIS